MDGVPKVLVHPHDETARDEKTCGDLREEEKNEGKYEKDEEEEEEEEEEKEDDEEEDEEVRTETL